MNNLEPINTSRFNGVMCDVYGDGKRIYMTRNQIGRALGYSDENTAICKIHSRHSDRLDQFSVSAKMVGADGKCYDTIVYSQRGIMEICRWSRQEVANQFMDWVWNIIELYSNGAHFSSTHAPTATIVDGDTYNQLTEAQISDMINNRLEQFKTELKQEMMALPPSQSECVKPVMPSSIKTTEDIIRETILPLAKATNDKTVGYNHTYRTVYDAMGVSWKHRQSRYKNQHNNKNKPSKFTLIASDPKLLRLFIKTVQTLIE